MSEDIQKYQNLPSTEVLEKLLIKGDLSSLTEKQRLSYYLELCNHIGLDPLLKPFDYIYLKT